MLIQKYIAFHFIQPKTASQRIYEESVHHVALILVSALVSSKDDLLYASSIKACNLLSSSQIFIFESSKFLTVGDRKR